MPNWGSFQGKPSKEGSRLAAGEDRTLLVATRIVVLLSVALILASAQGDLWMDEIWSLGLASSVASPIEILTHIRHDNNHILNTLFLFLLDQQETLVTYRLLSILSGAASLLLVARIARRAWGPAEAFVAVAISGTCFPLVLYFSEARGYAPAILCALLSYATLHRNLERFRAAGCVLFWVASACGVLSHGTFVTVSLALALAEAIHRIEGSGSVGSRTLRLAAHHAVPLSLAAGYSLWIARDMMIGGGPSHSAWEAAGQAAALLLGLADVGPVRMAALVIAVVVVTSQSIECWRQRDPLWAFHLSALFLMPVLVVAVRRPEAFYSRYFLVASPFLLLLVARLGCRWYRALPARWRWVPLTVAAIVLAGHVWRDLRLVFLGRGGYSAALEYIAAGAHGGVVRVGSDHDFRNRMVFEFYAPRVSGGERLWYVEADRLTAEPPDWLLMHSHDLSYEPPELVEVGAAATYRLQAWYGFNGYSGWIWYLFEREA